MSCQKKLQTFLCSVTFKGSYLSFEFSASACQRIHSELLASVNQIYVNLQGSVTKDTVFSQI